MAETTDCKVTVYNFLVHDGAESSRASTFKTTREVIQTVGGEVLESTAEEVPAEALDDQRRYRRVATGWGELN
ncbi:MAG: hypothetical protein ABI574_07025 [Burkholderiales bacterium]